jgi:hypothetical protein
MLDGQSLLLGWRENVMSITTHCDYLLCEEKANILLCSRREDSARANPAQ